MYMFLIDATGTRYDLHLETNFEEEIGIWPCVVEKSLVALQNLDQGSLATKQYKTWMVKCTAIWK